MNKKEIYNMHDMLKGNINRMFLTDELEELFTQYVYAKLRLNLIFNFNYLRLKEEEKNEPLPFSEGDDDVYDL